MKKTLLLFALFQSIYFTASAQNFRYWATYYGGSALDAPYRITTDASGNIYMTGQTTSDTGIATAGAHQTIRGGGEDAFLVKYNSFGVKLWGTYYGGTSADYGYGVKTDAAGNVYITGYTSSSNGISTAGAYQPSLNGLSDDAFIVKFNSAGVRLWGTYYGGEFFDQGSNIATDAANNVYLDGTTSSTIGIASVGAHQTTYGGGGSDGFLAKFNSGGTFQWGTYYGGPDEDGALNIASSIAGNVVICGSTSSALGIASGGFQNTYSGSGDAFVAKFNNAGVLQWATYYGGSVNDYGNGIAIGPAGNIYLAGQTFSSNNISSGGFQNTFGGFSDAFLVKFNSAGSRIWATYYGAYNTEEGTDVAVDPYGNAFLSGDTYSVNNGGDSIATPSGFQTGLIGSENNFIAAFNTNGLRLSATYYGRVHEEEAHVAVSPFGELYMSGWTHSISDISSSGAQNNFGGGLWDAFLVKFGAAVPDSGVIVPNDTLPPSPPVITTNPIKVYTSVSIYNGGSIGITNAVFKNFSPGSPLPAAGSAIINFTCDFSAILSASGPPVPVACTAIAKMKVTFSSASGATRIYNTEMLQLDLSGGTLPANIKFRESPTLASTGLTVITDIGGGQFRMASFFDVFTELSTDNGNTWQPNDDAIARLNLQDAFSASAIPTLGEWGMISLAILVLSLGVFCIRSRTV